MVDEPVKKRSQAEVIARRGLITWAHGLMSAGLRPLDFLPAIGHADGLIRGDTVFRPSSVLSV